MAKTASPPELKRYMERRLSLRLNANRQVTGVLRGFDAFMNLVLDDAVEDVSPTEKTRLGLVVRRHSRAYTQKMFDCCASEACGSLACLPEALLCVSLYAAFILLT